MKIAPFAAGACALVCFAGSPTRASIPGNLEERSNDGLLHVCRDVEPGQVGYVVCDEQDFSQFGNPYTASECTAAGLPAVCKIDLIPNVKLSGRLTLIDDDQPLDGDSNSVTEQSTLILELTVSGVKRTLIESFEGTKIGNWNVFDEFFLADTTQEITYTNSAQDALQFSNGNLVELGLAIRGLAQGAFPAADLSGAVAVLTSVARDATKPPTDASGDALGSAGYFRVLVRFARVRP